MASIATRWSRLRVLRDLYLNEQIYQEFTQFRAQNAETMEDEERLHLTRPGIHLPRDASNQPHQSPLIVKDFTSRFHKCLCLVHIGLVSRHLGFMSINGTNDEPWELANDAWEKTAISCNGERYPLSVKDRAQCLEIYEFIYLFLLRKVLTPARSRDWIEACGESRWPVDRWYDWSPSSYFELLGHCLWVLDPPDVLDMIHHEAWSEKVSYPLNLTLYMRERGMLDLGSDNHDWFSCFRYEDMLLRLHDGYHSNVPGANSRQWLEARALAWWRHSRKLHGSPFNASFPSSKRRAQKGTGKLKKHLG